MKAFLKVVFGFFLAIVLLVMFIGMNLRQKIEFQTAAKEISGKNIETPDRAKEVKNWDYSDYEDEMGGRVKFASTRSLNQIDFKFPYSGDQNAELELRIHPRFGKDVMLRIERGQFLCSVSGCQITVRFDKGKSRVYSANEPSDHSSTLLFIDNYKGFVSNLMRAKKVYMEATFYQEGNRVFEFDVAGLKW